MARTRYTSWIALISAAVLGLMFAGCEVLSFTPSRDNPNDPGATVVAAPVFDPPAGAYPSAQSVAITSPTAGATIRYTTDGSTPTARTGILCVAPVSVTGSLTLQAIAYVSGMTDSAVSSAVYTIAISPATPQGLSVGSATTSTLVVSWSASEGAVKYQLFRDTSDTGAFTTQVYDDAGLSYTDSGLTAGTTYYYRVQATNTYGTSALSAAVGGTTTLTGSAPAAPTNLSVTDATPTSLTISWATVSDATTYQLYRDLSLTGSYATKVHDGPDAFYTDTGLNAETTYYYKVRATNASGSSARSASVAGTSTAALAAPAAPTGLTVGAATTTTLAVSWASASGATSYQLYHDADASGTVKVKVYDGGLLSFTDTGLTSVTTYYYWVRANNAKGSSTLAGPISGATAAPLNLGGTWQSTTSLLAPVALHTGAICSGYIFLFGGISTTTGTTNTVVSAPVNANGTLGTWTVRSSFNTARHGHSMAVYNGVAYITLGNTGGTYNTNDLQYASLHADGTVGPWTTNPNSPPPTPRGGREGTAAVAYDGYLYLLGGFYDASGTLYNMTTVDVAPINADGSVGAFVSATPLATGRFRHQSVAYKGHLYVLGGVYEVSGGTQYGLGDVQYAPIAPDGSLGTWAATVPLPLDRWFFGAFVRCGQLYILGGYGSGRGNDATVYRAPINADGSLGSWVLLTPLPIANDGLVAMATESNAYVTGGYTTSYQAAVLVDSFVE